MKERFRQSMAWLHTWGGLLFGWLLFVVMLTGTLLLFRPEIDRWMRPELAAVSPPAAVAATAAQRYLERHAAGAGGWTIHLPSERAPYLEVQWPAGGTVATRFLDPATGEAIAVRDTEAGDFLLHLHFELHGGRLGMWIVGATGIAALVALVSGIVVHRRIFKDFFTLRPRASPHRAWLDAHNAMGVLTLPFQLMIAYTGVALFFYIYMPAGFAPLFGGSPDRFFEAVFPGPSRPAAGEAAPLLPLAAILERAATFIGPDAVDTITVRNPGDRNAVVGLRGFDDELRLLARRAALDGATGEMLSRQKDFPPSYEAWGVMVGLHFARFGEAAVRWLYAIGGLAGVGMVASGLILFAIKRHRRSDAVSARLVDALNVAVVAGLPCAVAGFLWANRLLPGGVPDRAAWEIGIFFATWLAMLPHAAFRPAARALVEQLGLAAMLCAAPPLLDALAAGDHLARSLRQGDWAIPGIDLGALAVGLLLAGAALAVARATAAFPRPGASASGRYERPVAQDGAA